MERRRFIKTGCAFCLLTAAGVALPSLTATAGTKRKVYKTELNDNKQAEIPLALFAESSLQIVRIKHSYYDIAVHKEEDGSYKAMLMKCTHMDNQLNITDSGFLCSQHGSEYDTKGIVTKGPAETPLFIYETNINETTLFINNINIEE